jgi:gliding motility-associated-like protein
MSVTDTCDRAVGEAYATNVSGGVPFLGAVYQYQWSSGDTLSIAVGLAEGNYNLIVTDDNGCTDTAWYEIENLKAPLMEFHTFPDHRRYYDQLDNPFFFIDISNAYWQNVVDWQWDFGDNTFGEDSIVSHSYAEAGEYTILLTIETQYNCWDTISKKILIDEYALYIPNAFTPLTGDVLNDEFKAYGYGIVNYTMKIYNRWGGMIFESDDINRGWDGTTRDGGNIASIGVYLYYIAVENIYGEIFKYEGKLDLLR